MKENKKMYVQPAVEKMAVHVEKGFAISVVGNTPNDVITGANLTNGGDISNQFVID